MHLDVCRAREINGKGFNGVSYIGVVVVKGLRGYMWLLGRRLYFKMSWRPRDTYYLGRVEDLLTASARLRRLLPKPVDVRTVVAAVAKALAMAHYLAKRCRGSPKWRYLPFEVEMAIEEAARLLTAKRCEVLQRAPPQRLVA